MTRELLDKVAAASSKDHLPAFRVGDTVTVSVKIVEGDKERIQPFRGTVIRRRGGGISETFTVRRVVNNEGVERTFPLHSPTLVDVEVVRRGRARRAKLYFLRERIGKATRLREVTEGAPARTKGAAETDQPPGPEKAEEE